MTSAQLTTSDGCTLDADLALPPTDIAPVAAVVLCHPHPQYGGNRFDTVVAALFELLPPAGHAALRFDFRREFAGGIGERLDVVAALDHLDAVARLADVPRLLVGYSFGATVALGTSDRRVRAIAAIAPPIAMMPVDDPRLPVLVLVPRHDQFSSPEVTEPVVRSWSAAALDVVESADHFLAGHAPDVAARVVAWLTTQV